VPVQSYDIWSIKSKKGFWGEGVVGGGLLGEVGGRGMVARGLINCSRQYGFAGRPFAGC